MSSETPEPKKKKIAILLPMGEMVHSQFFEHAFKVFFKLTDNYSIEIFHTQLMPLDLARNFLLKNAIESNADYYLWIDSDMIIPDGAIEQLIKADKDMVTGLYFTKTFPSKPVIRLNREGTWFEYLKQINFRDLLEIQGFGFGFVMMKPEAAKKVWEIANHQPFKFVFKGYKNHFVDMVSEDLTFCKFAVDAGVKMYCDTSVVVGHIGNIADEKLYLYQTIVKSATYTDKVLIKHIMGFLDLDEDEVIDGLSKGVFLVANSWLTKNPKSPEEIEKFYQDENFYIFDLAAWHMSGRKQFDELATRNLVNKGCETVLDYGCGIGANGILAAQQGMHVTFADYDCPAFRFCKYRVEKLGLSNVSFKTIGVDAIDGQFDGVMCFDVLEHLPTDEKIKAAIQFLKAKATKTLMVSYNFGKTTAHPMHLDATEELADYVRKEIVEYPLTWIEAAGVEVR